MCCFLLFLNFYDIIYQSFYIHYKKELTSMGVYMSYFALAALVINVEMVQLKWSQRKAIIPILKAKI